MKGSLCKVVTDYKNDDNLCKKVREVVKSYTSSLVEDLVKAAGPAEMLSIGDYNKFTSYISLYVINEIY